MDNAYKFSKPETRVSIDVSIENDYFVFTSKNKNKIDNNIPINNSRAFTQVARDSYEQQGLGLGLYIINRISAMFKDTFSINQKEDDVECVWKSKIKFL